MSDGTRLYGRYERRRNALFLLPLLIFLHPGTAVGQTPSYGIILIGQSNAEGQGENSSLHESMLNVPDSVEFYDKGERILRYDQHRSRHGIEVSMLHRIALNSTDKWVLVKYCRGGTSSYAWRPDWTRELADITNDADKGNLYIETIKAIRAAEKSHGQPIIWSHILAINGERESRFRQAAHDYTKNMIKIRNALNRDLHASATLIVLTLDLQDSKARPWTSLVRNQQEQMTHVHASGCQRIGIHYDAQGLARIGNRFSQHILAK